MKVERLSSRMVKPCRPPLEDTPCMVALSSIDLGLPSFSVPLLYVYDAAFPAMEALERGLSEVLCEYREWAGRLTVNASGRPAIHLNDLGAVLIEAQALGTLDDMVPFDPSPDLLDLLPPPPPDTGNIYVRTELLLVQVTRFACGRVTLGTTSNHQVADGEGTSQFFQAWASTMRGVPIPCTPPLHDRSALTAGAGPLLVQPVHDHVEYKMVARRAAGDPTNLALRRIHFSKELLKKIKAQASKGDQGVQAYYSTFVSLLSHVWKCITIARGLENNEGVTATSIAVNIRKRLVDPVLPKGYHGNAICHAYPQIKIKDLVNEPLSYTAARVHAAIARVDSDYVRSALRHIELQRRSDGPACKRAGGAVVAGIAAEGNLTYSPNLKVASWITLSDLHDVDFGCGTPLFISIPGLPFDGQAVFTLPWHNLQDGGIDVNLALFAPHMQKLQSICFQLIN